MSYPGSNPCPFGTRDGLRRIFLVADEWASRHQIHLAILILLFGTLPLVSVVNDPPHPDVYLYHTAANEIKAGKLPYRDFVFEYPPYAIALFLLPSAFGDENYSIAFKLSATVADAIIKCLLLVVGLQSFKGIRTVLPLALFCIAIPFVRYFYLQRYDVFPAAVSLIVLWLFHSRNYALSGIAIAVGAGLKLYPALLAPPLLVLAWRGGKGKQFISGLVGGFLPILLLSLWLPWWKFLAFHSARGLQAESLYASVLWLGHLLGLNHAQWEFATGSRCFEVHGDLAGAVLPWSRFWFLFSVGISTALVCWVAARSQSVSKHFLTSRGLGHRSRIDQVPNLALLVLPPLLAFVIFNQVFSPQFMIWLLPLAATAGLTTRLWIPLSVVLTTIMLSGYYPSPEYYTRGLDILQTEILITRNLLLAIVWATMVVQLLVFVGRGPAQSKAALNTQKQKGPD